MAYMDHMDLAVCCLRERLLNFITHSLTDCYLQTFIWWMPRDLMDDKSTLVNFDFLSNTHPISMPSTHWAITWANVDPDLCCHVALLGHSELNNSFSIAYENSMINLFCLYSNNVIAKIFLTWHDSAVSALAMVCCSRMTNIQIAIKFKFLLNLNWSRRLL